MTTANVSQPSLTTPSSVPADSSNARDFPTRLRDAVNGTIHFSTRIIDEVVIPSIKTFLETCDTNPQIAAVVATPALLAFLLVIAFLIISTLILVIWSLITIAVGVAFVVLGGLISLFFKLLIVAIATIPLAGIATGLLVGANAISQFIIKKLPGGGTDGMARAVKEIDWAQIQEGATTVGTSVAQWSRDAAPILLTIRDVLSTIGLALHSAIHTAMTGLHHGANSGDTAPSTPPREPSSNLTGESVEGTSQSVFEEPIKDETIDPVDISNLSSQHEASTRRLKQRLPFTNAADDETGPM
ncbi:hypothetical protein GALMADRAFT_225229 [Galerina marginata CBS 339.88]|uniref:Uncharacterized protein n=1 Tax=Galerina marginata (strain CBS 339.88) TaxID=685588 RepID=A0A067T1U2_GALM3|nr:hypothetical protein GALMADRAFT_225229 [Galerina marginata CBS 339.88]